MQLPHYNEGVGGEGAALIAHPGTEGMNAHQGDCRYM